MKFSEKSHRNSILYQQKRMRNDLKCTKNFGLIYVNRDSTFLVRKEEKRLRERMKSVRSSMEENDRVYLKRDKLLLNGKVIDSIDISNQLF